MYIEPLNIVIILIAIVIFIAYSFWKLFSLTKQHHKDKVILFANLKYYSCMHSSQNVVEVEKLRKKYNIPK